MAHWQIQEEGKQASERVGEGEPVFILRHTYATAEQARSAARSRLDQLARSRSTVRLTLANGNPKLRTQSRVTLIGFRSGVDGEWVATRVVHKLVTRGSTTILDAETPAELAI